VAAGIDDRVGVACHDSFLVRRNNPCAGTVPLGQKRAAAGIGFLVEFKSEPSQGSENVGPQSGIVLADAGREDEAVDTTQDGHQRADLSRDPIGKQCNGLGRVGIGSRLAAQNSHVTGPARYTEQTRPLVEQMLDLGWLHPQLTHQVERHSRVECTTAGGHRQTIQRRQTHGCSDALSWTKGAETCAAPEMCDDRASGGGRRIDRGQDGRDMLIGQAMIAVAIHAALGNFARKGEQLRQTRLVPMEGRIKTGNLRQVGLMRLDDTDQREIVRLVQWCERNEAVQVGEDGGRDQGRTLVSCAAVNDTMAAGREFAPPSFSWIHSNTYSAAAS
jgi:hypothetical protein